MASGLGHILSKISHRRFMRGATEQDLPLREVIESGDLGSISVADPSPCVKRSWSSLPKNSTFWSSW